LQELPNDQPFRIYTEQQNSNVVISDQLILNDQQARPVEFYIPSKEIVVRTQETGDRTVIKEYQKSRKKAKEINFSDFKRKDPVLSKFKELEEPHIPKTRCELENVRDNSLDE